MGELAVTSLTVEELLRRLKEREWLIPQFQREFVWSVGDVIDLVHSILCARPIGMATIWEQADDSSIDLGPLSLPDRAPGEPQEMRVNFSKTEDNPNKIYAVLDGLQRCTAVAMAFGGFRSSHGSYKTSGRYFLNVAATDPLEQIVFLKESDVASRHLDNDAICISHGLFPLASNNNEESLLSQWLRYIQAIRDHSFYPEGKLPATEELNRRDRILKRAFEGINKTKLAVYIVPDNYTLADICDVFEKLNTTGTKVSTVDLIHSWLYSETAIDNTGPVRLREWIDDFGQKDGAIGWASSSDRPELTVQMSTACHVALEEKPAPRKVGRGAVTAIGSVKASDLLATPTAHWKNIISKDEILAGYLGDFQRLVANGLFPWKWCPYPVSSTIYVALCAHSHFDQPETHPWRIDELNALYRAFFWRNALTNRYDQGFLTQLGADIRELKKFLKRRPEFESTSQWATAIEPDLRSLINKPLPSFEDLFKYLTDGRPGGAMQKALYLPMMASAEKDLLDEKISLSYPEPDSSVQLHHIYPRDWCRNNMTGELTRLLDKTAAGRDWVNSVANLMPLGRKSNNIWKSKIPGQVLSDRGITYQPSANIFLRAFIDEAAFKYLLQGANGIEPFWRHRADLMAEDLLARTTITI